MKSARDIKHSEAFLGMEFEYTSYSFSEQRIVDRVGTVTGIKTTETGRIRLMVDGRYWSNGAVLPTNALQVA